MRTITLHGVEHRPQIVEDVDEEEVDWDQLNRPSAMAELEEFLAKAINFTDKLYNKFRKRSKAAKEEIQDMLTVRPNKVGDELTRELVDAWNMFTGGETSIPSRDIGYVLRILGQNPTEDEIVNMVMKANCDWDGYMDRSEFVTVAVEILKSSVETDQMDDVRAAFRVFDHNNDGTISKEELRDAMVNFGTRCTDEEFASMFAEADKNNDGLIDFDEFVEMMLPSVNFTGKGQQ